ncbi:MAG: ankyrin repeat domain-containing protein [Chthoniobacterales bacterium]|nr:ankyrin repeat domain-containing protein [Chthoniobacterales bacterium]
MDFDFNELHRRIKYGDSIGLRRALDSGFDPNTRNRFGWTLLMLAASHSNGALCRLLLERGADVNAANKFGASPLAYAAIAGSHSWWSCFFEPARQQTHSRMATRSPISHARAAIRINASLTFFRERPMLPRIRSNHAMERTADRRTLHF